MLQAIPSAPRNPKQKENVPPQSNQAVQRGLNQPDDSSFEWDDDSKAQTRILQLRKARFKAAHVPSRKHTPPAHALATPEAAKDDHSPSPGLPMALDFDNEHASIAEDHTSTSGVLQEISNSSLRRKKNGTARQRASSHKSRSTSTHIESLDTPAAHAALVNYPAIGLDLFTPPNIEPLEQLPPTTSPSKTHSKRHNPRRSTRERRSINDDEASKYIEHLESQLAALQMQLQSLTSPSTSKVQSSKLRAMNNESKLLRQEVQDWETKFSDRLREHTDQHEVIVGSLRAQVRSLEREADDMQERLESLKGDHLDKERQIEAAHTANYDLERRLEVMSELLATSPGKVDLCLQDPMDVRRRSPTRPKSLGLPLVASSRPSLSPPRHAARQSHIGLPSIADEAGDANDLEPESPTAQRRSRIFDNGRREAEVSEADSSCSFGTATEGSESTLVLEHPLSPTHRKLNLQRSQTDSDSVSRPARQMRRFHGGAVGPRTLILPATSSTVMFPASAPVSAQPTPSLGSSAASPLSFDLSDDRDPQKMAHRRRSATWDDNDGLASRSRRSGSFPSITAMTHWEPAPITPYSVPPVEVIPEAGSAQSQISIGYADGKSLFDEFKLLQHEGSSSSNDSDSELSPATEMKRPCFPYQSLPISPFSARSATSHPPPLSQPLTTGVKFPNTESRRPLHLITALTTALGRSLARRAPAVRSVFTNVWDVVTLSRPVIEFRWWLIKLLIGDLRRKKRLWPPSRSSCREAIESRNSMNPGHSPTEAKFEGEPSIRHLATVMEVDDKTALQDVLNHLDAVKAAEQWEAQRQPPPPPPPPLYWLRFGLTLVFAMGIAIKDGPGSLLVRGE